MQHPQILSQLRQGKTPGLAAWMADPMDKAEALRSLARLQKIMRFGHLDEQVVFARRLGEIITRFWAGKDIEAGYENLLALLDGTRQQSILELCVGQLLIARRLSQAWMHLDRGFQLAVHLLEPDDYFLVLKRHELLRQLPLSLVGTDAATLDALLKEARVIATLRGNGTRQVNTSPKHQDTVD